MPGIYNLHINATILRATRSARGRAKQFIVLFVLVFSSVRFALVSVAGAGWAVGATCGRRTQIKMLISVKRSCAAAATTTAARKLSS